MHLTVARNTDALVAFSLDAARVVDAEWMEGMRGDGSHGQVPLVTLAAPESGDMAGTLAIVGATVAAGEPVPHQGRWAFVATEGFTDVVARLEVTYLAPERMVLHLAFRVPGHEALLAGVKMAQRLLFKVPDGPVLQVDPPVEDLSAVLRLIERAAAGATR
jgi:hypothetical protein